MRARLHLKGLRSIIVLQASVGFRGGVGQTGVGQTPSIWSQAFPIIITPAPLTSLASMSFCWAVKSDICGYVGESYMYAMKNGWESNIETLFLSSPLVIFTASFLFLSNAPSKQVHGSCGCIGSQQDDTQTQKLNTRRIRYDPSSTN